MLNLFSFVNFRPTADKFDVHAPGLQPIMTDDNALEALLTRVVAPIAQAME